MSQDTTQSLLKFGEQVKAVALLQISMLLKSI
jgi:hypothetical protein